MPANKKYLSSPGHQILKLSAALLGGYLVTTSFHLFILFFSTPQPVIDTMNFSTWLIWAALMLLAFLARNGWKIWAWYLLATLVFSAPYIYQWISK